MPDKGPKDVVGMTGMSGLAIASFVMAIVFFLLPWMFIPQIITILFGVIALVRIKKHGMRGKWFAIVAIAIATVHIGIAVFAIYKVAALLQSTDFRSMMEERVKSFVEDRIRDEIESGMMDEIGSEIGENIESQMRDRYEEGIAKKMAEGPPDR